MVAAAVAGSTAYSQLKTTSSPTTPGWRESGALRLALGDSGPHQQLGGGGCAQAHPDHRLHEGSTRDATCLDLLQQIADSVFIHRGDLRAKVTAVSRSPGTSGASCTSARRLWVRCGAASRARAARTDGDRGAVRSRHSGRGSGTAAWSGQ